MRCSLYARVSTVDQDAQIQVSELREYIARRGWEFAGEYVDTGFSGAKASRPALDRLMNDAAKRNFDCVVVSKIDRFGRSVLHLNQQLATLTAHGVRFIAVTQSIDTDAANPISRLLTNVLASVAEFERELIKERTLAGIHHARAKGKTLGRPKRIFRRDEVVRLRDEERLSWRLIGEQLNISSMTAYNAYQSHCKKIGSEVATVTGGENSMSASALHA